jgi:hypothetical protein
MNPEYVSRKMFAGTALSTVLQLVIGALCGLPITAALVAWFVWIGVMSLIVHEKISRCESHFFERAARFAGLVFCLFGVPALLVGGARLEPRVVVFHLLSSVAVGAATVAICYRLDPVGPGRYFSVSSKFRHQ